VALESTPSDNIVHIVLGFVLTAVTSVFWWIGRRHVHRIDRHGDRIELLERASGTAVTRQDLEDLAIDMRRERLEAHENTRLHQDALHRQNTSTIGALSSQVELLNKTLLDFLMNRGSR
jgi:hypothetical protein